MKLNYHFFFEKEVNPVHEDVEDTFDEEKPFRNSIIEAIKMLRLKR